MQKIELISEKVEKIGRVWKNLYKCFCGIMFLTSPYKIKIEHTKSCGCSKAFFVGKAKTKHSHARAIDGIPFRSRTYYTWQCMKTRCYNINYREYHYYGGRGIRVCERWKNDFKAFLHDMGERPLGTTIDRINPDGNYEPGNCRWADNNTQARNKRKNE